MSNTNPLVSVEWLKAHARDANVRIVDFRWYLQGKSGRDEYAKGHIPGAAFLALEDVTAPSGPGRHPIASGEQLAQALGAIGISNDTTVIAYDDAGGSVAARLWFLCELYGHPGQVKVLDGGLQAWTASGGELSTAVPKLERATWESRRLARAIVDKHIVNTVRADRDGFLLLDARVPERYRGETEPVDARPGHIPGARNAPWNANLVNGAFKDAASLRAQFEALGMNAKNHVVAYCGSGVTACHNVLALELAGIPAERVSLYEGSWSDWARDTFRPAALGDER